MHTKASVELKDECRVFKSPQYLYSHNCASGWYCQPIGPEPGGPTPPSAIPTNGAVSVSAGLPCALEESLRVVVVAHALRVEGLPVVDRQARLAAAERVAAITKALAVRAVALDAHHVCIERVPVERAQLIERGRRRREVGDAINVRAHRMANDVGEQLRAFW